MASIFDSFPSKYLKASDLQGRTVSVLMESVKIEKLDDGDKPVIYFQGKQKGLVLNRTNANSIAEMYGEDPRGWIGKEIALFPTRVDYKGERKDAIRVRFVQPQPPQPQMYKAPAPQNAVRPHASEMQQPVRHDERNPPPADDMDGIDF